MTKISTPEGVSDQAANIVAHVVSEKPNAVLGLATGSTPTGLYQRLVARNVDLSRVTTFNLDEYVGLDPSHPQSYHYFMWHHLFAPAGMRSEQVHFPGPHYEQCIAQAGGIDLQILGIGTNGHIAFNEPGSPLDSRTRTVSLSAQTIRDNARFFNHIDEVPGSAVTMGIATILDARKILLLATGKGKAPAVNAALKGPVTPQLPASALQNHPDVSVLLDYDAAALYT